MTGIAPACNLSLPKKSPQALYRQVGDLPHNYRTITYMPKWRRSLTCERLFPQPQSRWRGSAACAAPQRENVKDPGDFEAHDSNTEQPAAGP
jgi:hypothetical protein